MDFAKVLAELKSFFDRHGFRHGIAGAFALHAHGISRATGDLDLLVEDKARQLLLPYLDSLGYQRLHASEGFSNHLHQEPAWGRLDFIFVDDHTADLLFHRATRMELFPGVGILVPRPEHLAAMKVVAMKNDPSIESEIAAAEYKTGLRPFDQRSDR